jgi:hypothetical protein
MKKFLFALFLVSAASGAMAGTSVGVDINIGGPGYYGNIQLGDFGRPPVIYEQPMIIERQVRYVGEPMYLRVPPGHSKNWRKHCRHYGACGRPVYFVQDSWYNNTYAPRYRSSHRGHDGDRRDYRDDRRDDYRDDDRGHGHGNGHGKGHDKHNKHDKH